MSVIVKGMEMPVSGARYRVVEDMEGNKYLATDRLFSGWYYPISPLPEVHGKLIDADAFKETLEYYIREAGWDEKTNQVLGWVKDEFIDSEPTIVEAEGE